MGANYFLPSYALSRAFQVISRGLDSLKSGKIVFIEDLQERVFWTISSAVANHLGEPYNGTYPVNGCYLEFGTQRIDLDDATRFVLDYANVSEFFLRKNA